MHKKTKSNAEIEQDKVAFIRWLHAANDVPDQNRSHALKMMGVALREELTEKQIQYISAYYIDHLKMKEIGERYGVNSSTVSRVIGTGLRRIERVLRYSSPAFLKESFGATPSVKKRSRRDYKTRHVAGRRRKCHD